jgi:hypothetical protein
MGNLALIGKDRSTWGSSSEPLTHNMDLLAIKSEGKHDAFSTWFSQKFIYWFHHLLWHRVKKSNDVESGIVLYNDRTLQKYSAHMATVVASLLPILAIVVLYCVDAMNARLGLVAVFTVVSAACLSFFTNATRGEVFIATSTLVLPFTGYSLSASNIVNSRLAAVQVVFISTNNGTSSMTT